MKNISNECKALSEQKCEREKRGREKQYIYIYVFRLVIF